jgi:hypothetical protein
MSEFEPSVVAVLRARAADGEGTIDDVRARARLRAGLDRADRRRRRATWGAAALAVAMLATGLTFRTLVVTDGATPVPPVGPAPSTAATDHYVLATDPFLTVDDVIWDYRQRPDVATVLLSACVTDPRTWEAAQTRAATYVVPGTPIHVMNEYVMQYDDATVAHSRLMDAWTALRDCPSIRGPRGGEPLPPLHALRAEDKTWLDEETFTPVGCAPGAAGESRSDCVIRMARRGNIVVVLESSGIPTDRSGTMLTDALDRAAPGLSPSP